MDITSLPLEPLTAISPLDGRYEKKTSVLRGIFSEYSLIRYRVMVEIHWLIALADCQDIPDLPAFDDNERAILLDITEHFSLADAKKVKETELKTNHDVKAVEYFLREKLNKIIKNPNISSFIHFSCTSEDINNLSHALMLKTARQEVLLPELDTLVYSLKKLSNDYATLPMLARTHGQSASPTTLGKEIAVFAARLLRQRKHLIDIKILGKMNGAVGNFNAHQVVYPKLDWVTLSAQFIEQLGLINNAYTTQIEPHDYMAEYFHVLIHINTILLDLSRDFWGYISLGYFKQKLNVDEVGSSTMPHKVNPIDFENAEGNLTIANAIFSGFAQKLPISRWQRDLSDSTVLRNMGVAFGHTLLAYRSCVTALNKLTADEILIASHLENAWEVLAEPIQMMMRRYQISEPYEKLKRLTRGQKIDQTILHEFIKKLEIPDFEKASLLTLCPTDYIGNAARQAKAITNYNGSD